LFGFTSLRVFSLPPHRIEVFRLLGRFSPLNFLRAPLCDFLTAGVPWVFILGPPTRPICSLLRRRPLLFVGRFLLGPSHSPASGSWVFSTVRFGSTTFFLQFDPSAGDPSPWFRPAVIGKRSGRRHRFMSQFRVPSFFVSPPLFVLTPQFQPKPPPVASGVFSLVIPFNFPRILFFSLVWLDLRPFPLSEFAPPLNPTQKQALPTIFADELTSGYLFRLVPPLVPPFQQLFLCPKLLHHSKISISHSCFPRRIFPYFNPPDCFGSPVGRPQKRNHWLASLICFEVRDPFQCPRLEMNLSDPPFL